MQETILRRETVSIQIGQVRIGSDHPIVIQSMTNTDTADIAQTVEQIRNLAANGSEMVRVTVNNDAAAKAVQQIHNVVISNSKTERC